MGQKLEESEVVREQEFTRAENLSIELQRKDLNANRRKRYLHATTANRQSSSAAPIPPPTRQSNEVRVLKQKVARIKREVQRNKLEKVVPLFEHTGNRGRPPVTMEMRSVIMQLLDKGLRGQDVPAALNIALTAVKVKLDGVLKVSTVYQIQQEMGVVAKAHLAQTWISSQDPGNWFSAGDGTTSRLQNLQVRLKNSRVHRLVIQVKE